MTNGGKDKRGEQGGKGRRMFGRHVLQFSGWPQQKTWCHAALGYVCVCLVTGTTMAARQDCLCQHTHTNTHARIHTLKHSPRVNCNVVKRSGLSDFIKRFKRGRLHTYRHTHIQVQIHMCAWHLTSLRLSWQLLFAPATSGGTTPGKSRLGKT